MPLQFGNFDESQLDGVILGSVSVWILKWIVM